MAEVKVLKNGSPYHYLQIGSIAEIVEDKGDEFLVKGLAERFPNKQIYQRINKDCVQIILTNNKTENMEQTFKVGDKVKVLTKTSKSGLTHFLKLGSEAIVLEVYEEEEGNLELQGESDQGDYIVTQSVGMDCVQAIPVAVVIPPVLKVVTTQPITTMNTRDRKEAVLAVAKDLTSKVNAVTTKELKLELRNRYPQITWSKYANNGVPGVSELFHELVREGKFYSVGNNGTFQTYADKSKTRPSSSEVASVPVLNGKYSTPIGLAITNQSPTVVTAHSNVIKAIPAPAPKTKAPKVTFTVSATPVSRTKALDLMKNNKGRFFTVEFVKKDGSVRKLNGQYVKGQEQSVLGYVQVKESSKLKTKDKEPIRNVNLQTLQTIKVGGVLYKVK